MKPTMHKSERERGLVLAVDDDPASLGMLCEALAGEGYEVLAARNADEARQRAELVLPDAVLLDAIMPGRTGFEFCREIKSEPAWTHVPVIFMTGLTETEQIVNGFACGGVDYVVKPLKIPEVIARLAAHLRTASATRLAREAVDVAGMGIVLLDRFGRTAWRSPRALRFLEQAFGPKQNDPGIQAWLNDALQHERAVHGLPDGSSLQAVSAGRAGFGEAMLLLQRVAAGPAQVQRSPDVALTPRETEVLSWLAKGKTNRDIADILGMSPRTVNKHLEHIFEKLGVETRTAAAALAARMQAGQGVSAGGG